MRRGLGAALAAAIVALPAVFCGADVDAAQARTEVTTPRNGTLVTGKTVRVRVTGAGKGFEALVDSRDVTRRFKPSRGDKGVRIAVLRRGRDFSQGPNRLLVKGRGTADAVSFIGGRRARGMLKLRSLGARPGQTAIPVRARVGRDIQQVRLRLNGQRVPRRLWPRGRRSFAALLGADEGVRFGDNKLVATVIAARGVYDRAARTFRVDRDATLAGAGADRRTKAGRLVRLDGRATRSASGRPVNYAWRIVKRPRGSRATLRHVHSARPLLRPDKPGTYKVRLAAGEGGNARRAQGNGRTASASAARAAVSPTPSPPAEAETNPLLPPEPLLPTAPEPPASGEPGPAIDVMTVQAAPAVKPIGMAIQTIAKGGGIEVGGKVYTTTANWVQAMLLDRATLEVKANAGFDIDEAANLTTALEGAASAFPSLMVILSGGGRSFSQNGKPANGFSQANADALTSAFEVIGGDVSTAGPMPAGGMTFADGNWSIIGQGSLAPATATQNHGMATGGDGQEGSLTGYLQRDRFGNYAFVSPDSANLDTAAEGAAPGTNVIEVAGKKYQSQPVAGAGFQVLVLDGALDPVANETFTTNQANGAADDAGVKAMTASLRAHTEGSAGAPVQNLVIVQSIGRPGAASPAWVNDSNPTTNNPSTWGDTLAAAIGVLGGPAAHDQFAQMVAPPLGLPTPSALGGYTLVASTELDDPFNDAYSQSQGLSGLPSARVVGSLSRNHDAQWVLGSPSSTPGFEPGVLAEIAFQAPTPFPLDTGAYLTASEWIAKELGFTAPDVRTDYYENTGANWGSDLYLSLEKLPYQSGNGFTEAQYKELKAQLLGEFTMVDEVWKMIGNWKETFGNAAFPEYVDLQTIGHDILTEIQRQQGIEESPPPFDPMSLFASSLWMAQGIAGITGQEELEPEIGVAAAGADVLDSVASQSEAGGVATAPIEAEVTELGAQLAKRYGQISSSLAQFGNLFVSDWGKLQAASRKSNGDWATNSAVAGAVERTMIRAAQASYFTVLLPLAYGQYVLQWQPTDLNSKPWREPWYYRCMSRNAPEYTEPFNPTKNTPAAWMVGARTIAGPAAKHYTVGQVRLISTGISWEDGHNQIVGHEPEVLPRAISSTLFQPLNTETGLGLDQVRFFGNPAFKRWPIECEEFEE